MYATSLLLNKPRLELALLDEDQTMAEPALAELLLTQVFYGRTCYSKMFFLTVVQGESKVRQSLLNPEFPHIPE
jgi:hypothetical protein